jgi:hypothetical protein
VATPASLSGAVLRPAVQLGRRVDGRARQAAARPARWAVLSGLDATLSTLDAVLTSPLAQEAGERIRTSALAADVLEPLLRRAMDSPAAERLSRELVDSRLIKAFLEELPENAGIWTLIDEIAQSPAVTDAISHQGFSFADQMAGIVRTRSRNADDRVERIARRLARRLPRDGAPPDGTPAAGDQER